MDKRPDPLIGRPWMYSKPVGKENIQKWVEEWIHIILEKAEVENIHLINKLDLRNKDPFIKLDENSYDLLIKEILETKYLTYWGNGNLRIYWRSLQGWADHFVDKARAINKIIVYGLEDLSEIDPKMSKIPKSDLEKILQLAVDRGAARWVEKENNILKIS